MCHCRKLVLELCTIVVLLVAAFNSPVAQNASPFGTPPYLDPSLPMNIRVDDLVSRTTLEEKASQRRHEQPRRWTAFVSSLPALR
jgi:hypothetical protein